MKLVQALWDDIKANRMPAPDSAAEAPRVPIAAPGELQREFEEEQRKVLPGDDLTPCFQL